MSSFKYSYDSTASSSSNLISESQTISTNNGLPIIFGEGLAYIDTLVVTDTSEDTTLTVGTDNDYIFVGPDDEITARTGHPTASGILINDSSFTGTVTLSYQCVGGAEGKYSSVLNDLIDAIDAVEEDSSISWENITDKPSLFPPETHTHPVSQLTEINTVTESLYGLANALIYMIPMGTTQQVTRELIDGILNIQAAMQNAINQTQLVDNVNPDITSLQEQVDAMYDSSDGTATLDASTLTDILTASDVAADGDDDTLHYSAIAVVSVVDSTDLTHGTYMIAVDWSVDDAPEATVMSSSGTFSGDLTWAARLTGDDLVLELTSTLAATTTGKWLATL